jgi:hypothetical protein
VAAVAAEEAVIEVVVASVEEIVVDFVEDVAVVEVVAEGQQHLWRYSGNTQYPPTHILY